MPTFFDYDLLTSAQKLIYSAQRPLGDLSAVMASAPTITDPASDGANSTIQTGQTSTGGIFSMSDPTRVSIFGGPISGGRIQTLTKQAGSRNQGHGACAAFFTDADTVDFSLRCNAGRWIAYVTDPSGVRARIAAADRAQAFSNYNFYKLAFGSTAGGGRLIEIYTADVANLGGVNVANGYSIWPADFSHQPRIATIGDSYHEGSMNDTTLRLKLAMTDWFAGVFGVNNPHVNGIGSTGVIADAGASAWFTFPQRIAAGDMDYSRVGHFDLVFAPGSVNDSNTSNNGLAVPAGDATVQAAYQSYIAALMVAQPRAIIVGAGPSFSTAAAPASRTAAYKAGFTAAKTAAATEYAANPLATKGNADRLFFLDGTLFESAPDTGVVGADNIHLGGVFGTRHAGERLARQTLTGLKLIVA